MEQSNYRHSTQKIIYTEKQISESTNESQKLLEMLPCWVSEKTSFYFMVDNGTHRLFITASQSKYKPLLNEFGLVNGAKSSWLAAILLLSIYVVLCINITQKNFWLQVLKPSGI